MKPPAEFWCIDRNNREYLRADQILYVLIPAPIPETRPVPNHSTGEVTNENVLVYKPTLKVYTSMRGDEDIWIISNPATILKLLFKFSIPAPIGYINAVTEAANKSK
jgi:hypothetical protein